MITYAKSTDIKLTVWRAEPVSSGAPKTEGEKIDTFKRARGSSFALTCKAQGFPVPEFRSVSPWEDPLPFDFRR